MNMSKQTTWIIIAMVLGILVGYACNTLIGNAEKLNAVAGYFAVGTDIFLRMIKMIIAPLIFGALVSGLAGMSDASTLGRIGGMGLAWFIMASLISLSLGLIFANFFQPGVNAGIALPDANAAVNLKTSSLNLKEFVTHVFPRNIFESLANNEVLQILVFSLFFGLALGQLRETQAGLLAEGIEQIVPVMLKVTGYVMNFAPIGVFCAVANVVAIQGLGVLEVYGKFLGSFYLALAVLWALLIAAGYVVLRGEVFRLLRMTRQPVLIGFSTASSEGAYPRLMEQLERFGIKERIVGFMLPLGYSFNLDGSMMYTTFAAIFIAQVYNLPMGLEQQILMLLVLMVSSKGVAGVPRSALVVVAAVLPMFNLPATGVLLILGADHFFDMGRTATNVLGNAIATAVVAKWENAIERTAAADVVLDGAAVSELA
jgi:Na+/H+-dicarboxylate symporter